MAYFSSNRSDEGDGGEFVHRLAARGAVRLAPSTGEMVTSVAASQVGDGECFENLPAASGGGASLGHLRQHVRWLLATEQIKWGRWGML